MLKLARLIGFLTSLGTLILYLVLAFFNPYMPGTVSFTLPIALMMVTAIVGTVAAYLARPYLMLLVFVVAFAPIGFYLLGTPGLFRWIGIFELIYLAAAVAVWFEKRISKLPRKPIAS